MENLLKNVYLTKNLDHLINVPKFNWGKPIRSKNIVTCENIELFRIVRSKVILYAPHSKVC